jgi:hypothetical protein
MANFKNIKTQQDLEELFELTNFARGKISFEGIRIDPPDEDGYQLVWVPECSHMGTLSSEDLENSGEDALFVQTLVQMFKEGTLIVKEEK